MSISCRTTRRPAGSEKKGGRPPASVEQPGLVAAIERAVADDTAGSPVEETSLWTNRSPWDIAQEVAEQGYEVSPDTVRKILVEELELHVRQAEKDEPAGEHPARDEQFEHLAQLRTRYARQGWPVVSIDTKHKELLGNFYRGGAAYTNGHVRVWDHDFATFGDGRLVPYGVYDLAANEGFVLLSRGADTSEMACDALERWWRSLGQRHWWRASQLLVLCDCGGANGNRRWRFKEDLKQLAIRLGRTIQVAHYPPHCSKYNPIEHRLFCHLSHSLRGVVLKTMSIARRFLARTTTATGLQVTVEITRKLYRKGRQATAWFLHTRPVNFARALPLFNYTLTPDPIPINPEVISR